MIVISEQGDTLDLICWRYLGQTAGVTESALRLNPALTRLPARLPPGQLIHLPVNEQTHAPATLNLWD